MSQTAYSFVQPGRAFSYQDLDDYRSMDQVSLRSFGQFYGHCVILWQADHLRVRLSEPGPTVGTLDSISFIAGATLYNKTATIY